MKTKMAGAAFAAVMACAGLVGSGRSAEAAPVTISGDFYTIPDTSVTGSFTLSLQGLQHDDPTTFSIEESQNGVPLQSGSTTGLFDFILRDKQPGTGFDHYTINVNVGSSGGNPFLSFYLDQGVLQNGRFQINTPFFIKDAILTSVSIDGSLEAVPALPLPASLPLFGAGLLTVCALGLFRQRGRT